MTRAATGAVLALLNALEPEAKAAWEADLITIGQAISASQAITNRRQASVMADQATIAVRSLSVDVQANLPPSVRERNDPDFGPGETP